MPEGLIVKALSGYYYVLSDDDTRDGGVEEQLVQCRARGIFKKNKVSPLVGDRVKFELTENGEGMVDELLPRTTELIRPPVANVKQAVLVFSLAEPDLNLPLLDKFLVFVEHAGLDAVLCLTKHDLLDEEERIETEQAARLYESIGYSVFVTSALQGEGVKPLLGLLEGTISVVSGQSGVGKSTLLNALIPGLNLATNEISNKLGRGKHTTRHVELVPLEGGGWIADTPGFSQLDFVQLEPEELGSCFREFKGYAAGCKFRGCLHDQEPGCLVRGALESGAIAASRYSSYMAFLTEMRDRKRRY
ncbi:ribosome small subunit-dependent GTPase A [Paenibacillus sp. MBLB4367]|uniref:ribosome small subunit-dependent GTPase A n=1 Tax=Paenibacillus sp. MBLB4367 TaxID=3384767 RepID=UPI003908435E